MSKYFSAMMLLAVTYPAVAWATGDGEKWKITLKTDMPGMPMPEVMHTVCLPKGDAYMPKKVPHKRNCKITDIKVTGDTTSWKIHCPGRDAMDGIGEVTRAANTMKGTIMLFSRDIQMTQAYSGTLVGICQIN
jgi:hypothetical protein